MKNKIRNIVILIFFITEIFISPVLAVLPYNFENTESVKIMLSPRKKYSTKENLVEGQKVEFVVTQDVRYKDKFSLSKGDIIYARVETVKLPQKGGFPAEIIIDNFEIPKVSQSQLISRYDKSGKYKWYIVAIRTAFPFLSVESFILRGIKGSHVKLVPKDVIEVYYYPNWK